MSIGESVKHLRLLKNWDRNTLASKARLSRNAVRNVESGTGTVKSLIAICQALGKSDWLEGLAPVISINPLDMIRGKPRRRASRNRSRESQIEMIFDKMGFVYFIQEQEEGYIKI